MLARSESYWTRSTKEQEGYSIGPRPTDFDRVWGHHEPSGTPTYCLAHFGFTDRPVTTPVNHPRTIAYPNDWSVAVDYLTGCSPENITYVAGMLDEIELTSSHLHTLLLFLNRDDERNIEAVYTWLESFRTSAQEPDGLQAAKRLLDHVEPMLVEGKFDEIGEIMREIEIELYSETALLSLLRFTFVVKARIEAWENFRNRVWSCLRGRGGDATALMRGL